MCLVYLLRPRTFVTSNMRTSRNHIGWLSVWTLNTHAPANLITRQAMKGNDVMICNQGILVLCEKKYQHRIVNG